MPQVDMCVCETATATTAQINGGRYDPSALWIKGAIECDHLYPICGQNFHGNNYISLLKFDRLSIVPHGCDIVRATLYVYIRDQKRLTGNDNKILVFNNLDNFEGPRINWTARPRIETEPDTSLTFSANFKHSYTSCDITELVIDWHRGLQPNYGISLMDQSHDGDCIMLDSKVGTHPPYITIDYLQRSPEYCPPLPPADYLKNEFIDKSFELSGLVADIYSPSVMVNTSQLVSCFVKNICAKPFDINLQISPDNINFVDDLQVITVAPGETVIVTPIHFAKFMRLHVNNTLPLDYIEAKIWWQLQTNNYLVL